MTSRLEDRVLAAARAFRQQYADAVFDESLMRKIDQDLIDAVDALDSRTSVDLDVTPLAVGFDLRTHGIQVVVDASARSCRFDKNGETCTIDGDRNAIIDELRAAGYNVMH